MSFVLTFSKEDLHHLMGLHYLADRPDRRNRIRIYDDISSSESYRNHLSTSSFWTPELENRVKCTSILESLLDSNSTIFKYNPKRSRFYSCIEAEYLLHHVDIHVNHMQDVFLFIDKRTDSDNRFCKSIFPKGTHDYAKGQSVWTLLYKEKLFSDGSTTVLYQHKNYTP